jgi:transcriptional antiterminator RfaH
MLANQASAQMLFPADLLDESQCLSSTAPRLEAWWLLHTRSRQEKVVAEELRAREVGLYLPLVSRKSLSRGRPREALVPLFASYVFIYGDEHARLAALKTNRVAAVHAVADGEKLRQNLAQIASLIASGAALTPESRLEPGQRVRVKSGPCSGLEGTLVKRQGNSKLVVWIEQLLCGASVEIDDYYVEAI